MIDEKTVEKLHTILIDNFGGSYGVRDRGLLSSALARPYVTFDQVDLYYTTAEKAAAIFESIVINHPFVDGNKRTGYLLMRLTLLNRNFDIVADEDEKYNFTIAVSTGNLSYDEIKSWIVKHLVKIKQ